MFEGVQGTFSGNINDFNYCIASKFANSTRLNKDKHLQKSGSKSNSVSDLGIVTGRDNMDNETSRPMLVNAQKRVSTIKIDPLIKTNSITKDNNTVIATKRGSKDDTSSKEGTNKKNIVTQDHDSDNKLKPVKKESKKSKSTSKEKKKGKGNEEGLEDLMNEIEHQYDKTKKGKEKKSKVDGKKSKSKKKKKDKNKDIEILEL